MRLILNFKYIVFYWMLLNSIIANASIYMFDTEEKLRFTISKAGLNRISNPPYKIIQLTGDDSKFRIKYDEDGSNIYFMPLSKIDEHIEISIKNNIGHIYDLELTIADIKGQSIIIDTRNKYRSDIAEKTDIAEMLRAMKDNIKSKFYVQNTHQIFDNIGNLRVKQVKIYRYKELVGGVFKVTNPTRKSVSLKTEIFAQDFDKVKSFYPELSIIPPKQTITLLIVQIVQGK